MKLQLLVFTLFALAHVLALKSTVKEDEQLGAPPIQYQFTGAKVTKLPKKAKVRETLAGPPELLFDAGAVSTQTAQPRVASVTSYDPKTLDQWEIRFTDATLTWANGRTDNQASPASATISNQDQLLTQRVTKRTPLGFLEQQSSSRKRTRNSPSLLETREQKIIGQDPPQVRIANSRVDPYAAIGRLSFGCTGTLISSRVLLTAAHCYYNGTGKYWYKYSNQVFSPAQNGATSKPFGSFDVLSVNVATAYINNAKSGQSQDDWAIVVLKSAARGLDGSKPGWFGFEVVSPVWGLSFANVTGYPQSKNEEMWTDGCVMVEDWGSPGPSSTRAFHLCDTEPGDSGAPIHIGKVTQAIHSGAANSKENWNRACQIEEHIKTALLSFKAKYP